MFRFTDNTASGAYILAITLRCTQRSASALISPIGHERVLSTRVKTRGFTGVLGKFDAAKDTIALFLDQMDFSKEKAGLVSFPSEREVDQRLTQDRTRLNNVLNGFDILTGEGSPLGVGINEASEELQDSHNDPPHKPVMVVVTDGRGDVDPDPLAAANTAKAAGIHIVTIGIGNPGDATILQQIASSPADYYFAPTAGDLARIYLSVATDLRCVP